MKIIIDYDGENAEIMEKQASYCIGFVKGGEDALRRLDVDNMKRFQYKLGCMDGKKWAYQEIIDVLTKYHIDEGNTPTTRALKDIRQHFIKLRDRG